MHLRAYKGAKNPHKNHWIRRLKRSEQQPILQILEQVAAPGWATAERKWIAHFRALGMPLTNIARGGKEPPHGQESNKKRAASVSRYWATLSDEGRRERGQISSQALREYYATHRVSEEHRRLCRERQIGRKHTETTKRKISAAHRGKTVSDETRRKLSDVHRGRKPPPLTDEGRERIRETARARWARVSPVERSRLAKKARAAQLAALQEGTE